MYEWREDLVLSTAVGRSLFLLGKIIIGELIMTIIAWPMHVIVSSAKVSGFEGRGHEVIRFRVRRTLVAASVVVVCLCVGIWYFITAVMIKPFKEPYANTVRYQWSFSNPTSLVSFAYDENAIRLIGGSASLVVPAEKSDQAICQGIIEAREAFSVLPEEKIVGFSMVGSIGKGAIGFQVSPDGGGSWYKERSGSFKRVASAYMPDDDVSSVAEIQRAFEQTPRLLEGKMRVLFRARLKNPCRVPVELMSVALDVEKPKIIQSKHFFDQAEGSSRTSVSTHNSLPAALESFQVSRSLTPPFLLSVTGEAVSRTIVISGYAPARTEVTVYIQSQPELIYRTHADQNGRWEIHHDQQFVTLANGRYTAYAVARDPLSPFVSEKSSKIIFVLEDPQMPHVLLKIPTASTFITTLLLVVITIVFLYRKSLL
jgi:hypothetical protein